MDPKLIYSTVLGTFYVYTNQSCYRGPVHHTHSQPTAAHILRGEQMIQSMGYFRLNGSLAISKGKSKLFHDWESPPGIALLEQTPGCTSKHRGSLKDLFSTFMCLDGLSCVLIFGFSLTGLHTLLSEYLNMWFSLTAKENSRLQEESRLESLYPSPGPATLERTITMMTNT